MIRFAGPDDAEAIHELIQALAEYEREPDAVQATPESLRAQLAEERPPFECLLAEEDGHALGFALFFHTYSTWEGRRGLYLEDLFVREEARGAGIGKALLQRLAELALERDCGRLELAVLTWNTPAIDFYAARGGTQLAEWDTWRFAGEALERLANADA